MEDRAILLPRMQPLGDIDEDELLFANTKFESESRLLSRLLDDACCWRS